MSREEQLGWEARMGRPAAAAAVLAAVLPIAGAIVYASALSDAGDGERGALVAIDENAGAFTLSRVLGVIGLLALAAAVGFLYRLAKARRPETPSFALPLALAGAVIYAASVVINLVDVLDLAGEFADSGPRTERRADDLLEQQSVVGGSLGLAGRLAVGFALVLVSLNAMRAGLLSRFMGYLGIIVGVVVVIPLLGLPVVQLFWFIALGLLFLGVWPGGRGPAWDSGEAVSWPSAADRMERPREGDEPAGEPQAEPDSPSRPSRKRKKRRR